MKVSAYLLVLVFIAGANAYSYVPPIVSSSPLLNGCNSLMMRHLRAMTDTVTTNPLELSSGNCLTSASVSCLSFSTPSFFGQDDILPIGRFDSSGSLDFGGYDIDDAWSSNVYDFPAGSLYVLAGTNVQVYFEVLSANLGFVSSSWERLVWQSSSPLFFESYQAEGFAWRTEEGTEVGLVVVTPGLASVSSVSGSTVSMPLGEVTSSFVALFYETADVAPANLETFLPLTPVLTEACIGRDYVTQFTIGAAEAAFSSLAECELTLKSGTRYRVSATVTYVTTLCVWRFPNYFGSRITLKHVTLDADESLQIHNEPTGFAGSADSIRYNVSFTGKSPFWMEAKIDVCDDFYLVFRAGPDEDQGASARGFVAEIDLYDEGCDGIPYDGPTDVKHGWVLAPPAIAVICSGVVLAFFLGVGCFLLCKTSGSWCGGERGAGERIESRARRDVELTMSNPQPISYDDIDGPPPKKLGIQGGKNPKDKLVIALSNKKQGSSFSDDADGNGKNPKDKLFTAINNKKQGSSSSDDADGHTRIAYRPPNSTGTVDKFGTYARAHERQQARGGGGSSSSASSSAASSSSEDPSEDVTSKGIDAAPPTYDEITGSRLYF